MSLLIKNNTLNDIEVDELGILVPAGEVYDLGDDVEYSGELAALVAEGYIVYCDAIPDPRGGVTYVEKSPEESAAIAESATTVDLSGYYRKDEIDNLINGIQTEIYDEFNALVGNAPDTLNTLSELADALADDADFANSITQQLAGKADTIHHHNEAYYLKSEVDTLLNGYAPSQHSHSQYALVQHGHEDLAPIDHNHDQSYANLLHNHDQSYAPLNHGHSDLYYTKTQIDQKIDDVGAPFGKEYTYWDSIALKSSMGTKWDEKFRAHVKVQQSGYYRIGWFYHWNTSKHRNNFRARIQHWGSGFRAWSLVSEHFEDPDNAYGSYGNTNSGQHFSECGFKRIWLDAGDNWFNIEFSNEGRTTISSMWDARLELWRVS